LDIKIFLSDPGSCVRQATLVFSCKIVSIAEVNCRFIDKHPCLGSILNVFHTKIYRPYPQMLLRQR